MTESNSNNIDNLLGQNIDGYQIVQRIGSSTVFLAFKENPDIQFAVKVFYPDPYACNREEIIERLRSISQLEHENIVNVVETGENEDFVYAVMEYVPGENLYDLMQRNPRLHWAAAAELARDIIRGLVHAHAYSVTHRSLHPDRILLGKGGQVKINFCNEGEITPSGEIANYVSPEIFLGQPLEAYSDIYSLGAIMYHIITGNPPLSGKSPKEIALQHREMEPVLPNYGVADIPHSLSLVLSRALSKELKQRYQNAYELQAAIDNFLLNDIKTYKIGSYKELLPKVVEVSESGRAFNVALEKTRQIPRILDTSPLIEMDSLKADDTSEITITKQKTDSEIEFPNKIKSHKKKFPKEIFKTAICASIASFIIQAIVLIVSFTI